MAQFAPLVLDIALQAVKAKKQNKAAASQLHYKNSVVRRNQEIDTRRKRGELKKATATQRARFGAMGLGLSGGSADAVLKGMTKSVDQEIAYGEAETGSRMDANTATFRAAKRQNLLALSAPVERIAYGLLKSKLAGVRLLD